MPVLNELQKQNYLNKFLVLQIMPIRREESRKAKLISTAIIGFVMLSSIIGFSFSQIAQIGFDTNPEQKFSYGHLKLTAGQNSYSGEIDGKTYEFLYRPEELASVDADELAQTLKSSVQVYTTSDAQSRLAGQFRAAQFDFARAIAPNILEIGFTEENPFGK